MTDIFYYYYYYYFYLHLLFYLKYCWVFYSILFLYHLNKIKSRGKIESVSMHVIWVNLGVCFLHYASCPATSQGISLSPLCRTR